MANIKQTVDFSQGTLNNLVVVNNKLQLPSGGSSSFSRNSIAYLSDGTLVNTNLPRYETGKFGKAVMVEEGTTNGISYAFTSDTNLLQYFTDTRSGYGSITIDATQTPPLSGQKVIKHYASVNDSYIDAKDANGVNYITSSTAKLAVTGGSYVTFSIWAKGQNGGEQIEIIIFDYASNTGSYRVKTIQTFTITNTWQRYIVTCQTTSDAVRAWARVDNNLAGQTIYWCAPQLENKAYVTSFTPSTRSPETLTIPNANVFNKSNWNLEFLFNPTSNQVVSGKTGYLWENYIDANNYYALKVGSDGKPYLEVKSNGTIYQTSTAAAPVLNVGTWYDIKIRGNGSLMAIAVNGTKISEVSYVEPVGNLPANMYIGSDHNGSNHANALFEDLRISAIARSDTEWTNTYTSGQPLPVDEWTTYKLQLSSVAAPSFTRNSIAYKNDGTLVNTNLPRFEPGKFGKAITMEEGTTNLFKNASFEVGTGSIADGWTTSYNSTVSPSYAVDTSVHRNSGSKSQKISITSSTGLGDAIIYQRISCSANTTYTLSFYAKGSRTGSGVGFILVQTLDSSLAIVEYFPGSVLEFIPSNDWQRYVMTFTTASNVSFIAFSSGIRAKTAGDTVTIYIDDVQLEQKPYATSCVFANDTTTQAVRPAETLTIPTTNVLNPSEGTIEVWVYVNDSIKQTAENRYIFDAPASTTGFISLYHKASTNEFVLHIKNESGNESSTSISDNDVPNGWHKFTVRWTSSEASLILDDGTTSASISNPYLPQSFSTNATLGYSGTSGYINTMIDEIRISNKARSDTEIEDVYYSQRPMPVDEWTTYLLRFDDNLNYGQGGYYISPEYDVSSVNKAARGKVYWQEDADGIQRIVYAKLDNQADWTQVTNGGLLPISAGDVLTNRKLQLKVKMLKVI